MKTIITKLKFERFNEFINIIVISYRYINLKYNFT